MRVGGLFGIGLSADGGLSSLISAVAAPEHSLCAYLRSPDGDGSWPGVVFLHDALGQTGDSRRQVGLTASGYLAIAPGLYSRGNKEPCIPATFRDLLARRGAAFDDIDAVRSALADRDDCTRKVGVLGLCMGDSRSSPRQRRGVAASSVNCGMVPKDGEAILRVACPVIGSFGS